MKSIVYALVAALTMVTPSYAQSWSANTFDSGSLLFAGAGVTGGTLGFGCTAPSPQGLSLIETGSHESHRTDPFEITVGFSDSLFEWNDPYVIEGIVLYVDDIGYGLPPLDLNELQGSAVYLPMTDQMVLALFDAQRLVLNTGQGVAYEYPVDGLTQALDTSFIYCVDRWAELGHTIPTSLNRFWREGVEEVPHVTTTTPVPTPGQIPQFIYDAAIGACSSAGYNLDAERLRIADLDGDGIDDYLLNHSGVRCVQGLNGNCGAANCSIDAFLSTQGFALRDAFLGMSADLVPMPDGRTGVQISGTYSLCGETGLCLGPQVWNGSEFALLAEEGAPVSTTPAEPPQFILDRVASGCGAAGYSLDHGTGLGVADFDQDGQPDYVFNGAGVRCYEGINPFCGASSCSVNIHLSSRNYEIVDGYIGTDFEIQTALDGRPGFMAYGDPTRPLMVWNGSDFVPDPAAATAPAPVTGPTK